MLELPFRSNSGIARRNTICMINEHIFVYLFLGYVTFGFKGVHAGQLRPPCTPFLNAANMF